MMAAWARGHGGQAFHAVADSLTNLRHQLLLPRPAGHEDLLAYWQRVLNLAQVPADGDRDHLTREPEASEHRGQAGGRHRTVSCPPRSTEATAPLAGVVHRAVRGASGIVTSRNLR